MTTHLPESFESLEQLYHFMEQLQPIRRRLANDIENGTPAADDIGILNLALNRIQELPGDGYMKQLEIDGKVSTVSLEYEIQELERDVEFLDHPEADLAGFQAINNEDFRSELDQVVKFLEVNRFHDFITDRDGTISNYCAHYRSSHQAIYNAVSVASFAACVDGESVLLTSAPLKPHGIISLNTISDGRVHLAGSKGREYLAMDGRQGAQTIDPNQQHLLEKLNQKLGRLLEDKEYRIFSLIGSGVQYKFGQTTVARQDIEGSIDTERSRRFLETVSDLVRNIDPSEDQFGIEDTGKDIEIMLNLSSGSMFSKGDGVAFLYRELGLDFSRQAPLVCGDTPSDLPMVEKAVSLCGGKKVPAIFVGADTELKSAVAATTDRHLFVSTPDALVAGFGLYAQGQGS